MWDIPYGDSLPSFHSFGSVPFASSFHSCHPSDILVKFLPSIMDLVIRFAEQKVCPSLSQDLAGHHSQPSPSSCMDIFAHICIQYFQISEQLCQLVMSPDPSDFFFPPHDSWHTRIKAFSFRRLPKTLGMLLKKEQKSFGNDCIVEIKCEKFQSGVCLPKGMAG